MDSSKNIRKSDSLERNFIPLRTQIGNPDGEDKPNKTLGWEVMLDPS
jgi:hypothetical protein